MYQKGSKTINDNSHNVDNRNETDYIKSRREVMKILSDQWVTHCESIYNCKFQITTTAFPNFPFPPVKFSVWLDYQKEFIFYHVHYIWQEIRNNLKNITNDINAMYIIVIFFFYLKFIVSPVCDLIWYSKEVIST